MLLEPSQHVIKIAFDLFVRESYDVNAKAIDDLGPDSVLFFLIVVNLAVDFDGEFHLVAVEISYSECVMISYTKEERVLSIELQSEESPVPDPFPELPFCRSRPSSEFSAADFCGKNLFFAD